MQQHNPFPTGQKPQARPLNAAISEAARTEEKRRPGNSARQMRYREDLGANADCFEYSLTRVF